MNIDSLLGVHISISDTKTGFSSANSVFKFAEEHSINSFSIFLPKFVDFSTVSINTFSNVFVHSSFIHNPCSLEKEKYEFSRKLLFHEARLCEKLNINYLVFHPGSNLAPGDREKRLLSLNNLCDFFELYSKENVNTKLLMENSCGSGAQLFHNVDDFEYVFEKVSVLARKNIGICLDTCHLFQAGYDISKENIFLDLFYHLQRISFNSVFLFHLNDSKYGLNKHVDRHEKIGFGCIGDKFYHYVKSCSMEYKIPMILETPGKTSDRILERSELLS